jgi:hypothetical protein
VKHKKYPLEDGGQERLEISWRRAYKDFVVKLDGQQVNPEPFTKSDINSGQRLLLPDGSNLYIHHNRAMFGNELQLSRDGVPLPGSAHHPAKRAKSAAIILWLVAGLTLIAVALLYFGDDFLDWIALGSVLVYAVLGMLVFRGSRIALWTGLVIYGLDTAVWIGASLVAGSFPLMFIAVRIGLIVGMAKALPALRELKVKKTESIIS